MKIKLITLLTATLLSVTACGTNQSNLDKTMNLSIQEKAVALLNSIETGDQSAVGYVNPAKYTQHNLAVGDGLAGFGEVLQALPKNSAKVNVVRSFTDGDYVFTHTDYNFFGPKIGFDLFKFEDGLIVEHWDNLQEIVEKTASGRSQIDGAVEVKDLDKTQGNKKLVENFDLQYPHQYRICRKSFFFLRIEKTQYQQLEIIIHLNLSVS